MRSGIEIRGLDKLLAKYRKLGKDTNKAVKNLTEEAVLYAHSQVPPYPYQRPEARYRRTNTLGRTITTRVDQLAENEYAGILGTNTEYAPWVISTTKGNNGAGPQAWFHKGVWWTLQGVVSSAKDKIIKVYERGIKRLLKEADRGT